MHISYVLLHIITDALTNTYANKHFNAHLCIQSYLCIRDTYQEKFIFQWLECLKNIDDFSRTFAYVYTLKIASR